MAVDIIENIITGGKGIITATLPNHAQIDYGYDTDKNSDKGKGKAFDLIVGPGDVGGGRLGFITIEQAFTVILTEVFNNQDDETKQRIAVNNVYENAHDLLKVLVRSKMGVTPAPTGCVDKVTFNSFDDLIFIDDNSVVVLNTNILVSYRYQT